MCNFQRTTLDNNSVINIDVMVKENEMRPKYNTVIGILVGIGAIVDVIFNESHWLTISLIIISMLNLLQ